MTQKKLTRSINNRKISGVCGGLGEYFNIDPLIFRIVFLFLLFCGGSGFFLYLFLLILIPEDRLEIPHTTTYQESDIEDVNEDVNGNSTTSKVTNKGKKDRGIFWGMLLVALGLLWLGRSFGMFHFHWCNLFRLWPLLIISIGITLLPIPRLWKNVCNFILLVVAILFLFLLPLRSCRFHFWDDDFGYEIKRAFKDVEWNIKEDSKAELTQKEIKITDNIKGIIIEGPWEVNITQDDTNNSATIEYDVPASRITTEQRSNGYLFIRVSSMSNFRHKTLNANINAASLEKIKVSGAAKINTYGQFASDCDISVSGASKMDGFICEGENANVSVSGASKLNNFTFKGERADVDISGASKIDLQGMNVKQLKVNASGASQMTGEGFAGESSITGSGSSHFYFYDLESENLTLSLSGASSAEVTVNETIKGTLTGASKLKYQKADNVSGVSTTGGSKIVQVK